jgi:uncharacterized protein YggE
VRYSLLAVLTLLPPVLFAQLDPYTITVTASRSIYVQPDQVVVGVDINTNPNTGLDQVIAAIPNTGITAANLTGVSTLSGLLNPFAMALPGGLDWSFAVTVPIATLKVTTDNLSAAANSLASGASGMTLTFSLRGTQASAQALAAQPCHTTDLMADARARALKLASAAGFGVGPVLAISDSSLTGGIPVAYVIATAGFITGAVFSQPPLPATCAISVKFRLVQT